MVTQNGLPYTEKADAIYLQMFMQNLQIYYNSLGINRQILSTTLKKREIKV